MVLDLRERRTTCIEPFPCFINQYKKAYKKADYVFSLSLYYVFSSGDVHTEEISVAGLTAHNQAFAIADQMSSDWTNQP